MARKSNIRLLGMVGALSISVGAYAQELVSRPAGYMRVDLAPSEQRLMSLPFDSIDHSLNSVLGGQLSGGRVLTWDSGLSSYNTAINNGTWVDGSGNPSEMTLSPGEGFWLVNTSSSTQTVFLSGAVLLDDVRTLTLQTSLSLIGYPYSSAIGFSNTVLGSYFASGALAGDEIIDPTAEINDSGVMQAGDGYWYDRKGATVEVPELRPYENPFPEVGKLPSIAKIQVGLSGVVLTLELQEGATSYDIFSKELPNNDSLVLDSGWNLVAASLPAGADQNVEWMDSDVASSSKLYLLARADVDLDGNGIPDARERFVRASSMLIAGGGDVVRAGTEEAAKSNVQSGSSNAKSKKSRNGIIYVDKVRGSDGNDGFAKSKQGASGPKKSIRAGIAEARVGDTIEVQGGVYPEGSVKLPDGVRMVCVGRVILE